jgi:hypothetical protein
MNNIIFEKITKYNLIRYIYIYIYIDICVCVCVVCVYSWGMMPCIA